MRTGNKPQPPRGALAKLLPNTPDVEKLKEDGWREHGILVISTDHPKLGWIEKQVIEQLGDRIYGKGRRAHG